MIDTKKLRQKILDLAIRGKLVPQDPNDEPASVLLERIRAEKERLISEGKIKRSKKSKASSFESHYQNFTPPFDIPNSWEWVRLDELCVFLSRGKSPKYSDKPNEYPVFAQKCNLKEGGISLKQARFLDAETVDKWDVIYRLCDNDILINSTGTGTVGRTRLFKSSYLENYPFTVPDSHVSVVRLVGLINAEYIFSVISSDLYQQYLQDNLSGSTNQKELYIDVIGSMVVPLPPTYEQEKISVCVGNGNTLVANIEKASLSVIDTIQKCKAKILELAMQGKIVPQDPTDEPAIDMLRRINPKAKIITDNPHSWNVPNGWCITDLKSIGKWQSGATPSKLNPKYYGKGYPWLNTGDLNDGFITSIPKEITELAVKETSVKLNPKGSVLIAMYGATIGKLGILAIDATTNQACCACANCFIDNKFLFDFLLYYRPKFIQLGGGGAQPNISKEKIESTVMLLPPLYEQRRIVAKLEELYKCLDKIEASLQS